MVQHKQYGLNIDIGLMKAKWIGLIMVAMVFIAACNGKKTTPYEIVTDTEIDEYEYEHVDVPDTTSAEVAAWLQTVSRFLEWVIHCIFRTAAQHIGDEDLQGLPFRGHHLSLMTAQETLY